MHDRYHNLCILLAGGKGLRLGGITPKQYLEVDGHMIIEYALKSMLLWKEMDSLVIVADSEWTDKIDKVLEAILDDTNVVFIGYAAPGTSRQESILSGLKYAKEHMDNDGIVAIHDSARPFVSERLICECFDKMESFDGATPMLQVKETVYESIDGIALSRNLNRDSLFIGQTPEFFHFGVYLKANERLSREELECVRGSAQPAVESGMKVAVATGEESNIKITTVEDLELFKRLMER